MKSSRERMRKDEIQLTISLIPLAIESNRLFPSEWKKKKVTKREKYTNLFVQYHLGRRIFVK